MGLLLLLGFKTTHTVVWCADRTRTQGSKITPQPQFYPQLFLTFFIKFFDKKYFQKDFKNFFQNIEKSIQMNCGGGVRVRTTPHLKKLWLCGPHNHTKT